MGFHKARFAPTEQKAAPPWFQPPPPPDPRPLTHPRWPSFVRWVKSGKARVNPRLVDSPEQYGLHGELLFEAFVAGEVTDYGCVI